MLFLAFFGGQNAFVNINFWGLGFGGSTFVAMAWYNWFTNGKKADVAAAAGPAEQRSTLSQPEQWLIDWARGGGADPAVNANTSLSMSTLYACTDLRGRTMGSLQLGLYERLDNGDIVEITDAPEYFAVCVQPTELYGSFHWRKANQLRVDLHGNSFNFLHFDRKARVAEIELIDNPVRPFVHKNKLYYEVTEGGVTKTYSSWEILHLKGLTQDGIIGLSPIQAARKTLQVAMASRDYVSKVLRKGGILRGFVESPSKMTDPQVDELTAALKEVMTDFEGTMGVGILQNNNKFTPVSLSPGDVKFIEIAKMTSGDICRYFAVPPHMVGDLERATNNNIEHLGIEYGIHCVRPMCKSWEDELNRVVIPRALWGRRFFRFNIDSLLRGDNKSRGTFYKTLWELGAFSADDIRALENMNALPDGQGKKYYRPLNFTSLDEQPTQN